MGHPESAADNMFDRVTEEIDQLQRDFAVLHCICSSEPIGITELSARTGEHQLFVRASLDRLHDADLIAPTANGARTTAHTPDRLNQLATHLGQLQTRLETQKKWSV